MAEALRQSQYAKLTISLDGAADGAKEAAGPEEAGEATPQDEGDVSTTGHTSVRATAAIARAARSPFSLFGALAGAIVTGAWHSTSWPKVVAFAIAVTAVVTILRYGIGLTRWSGTSSDGRAVEREYLSIGEPPLHFSAADLSWSPPHLDRTCPSPADVRRWAKLVGEPVGTRGPVRAELVGKYRDANAALAPAASDSAIGVR